MTNRILDFSESPARLRVQFKQLIVQRPDESDVSLPLAELAVVIAAHPQLTYTHAVLAGLAVAGGVFVTCDGRNLPVGMLLPLAAHFAQAERFAAQARAAAPVRKRIWQQIVRAKIKAQADLLNELHGDDNGIAVLADRVRSGDPSNVEARAARRYWPMLFSDSKFRRHRENEDQNLLLNYGYAVLRGRSASFVGHPSPQPLQRLLFGR
jgi:CRISPR-associated protein Cas1